MGGNFTEKQANALTGAGSRAGFDEEEDPDMKLYQANENKMTARKLQDHQRQIAVNEHKKWMSVMNTHPFSMENPKFKQHLVVTTRQHCYVMLKTNNSLDELSCSIVPIKQSMSARNCPEEVWEEMQSIKADLRRGFGGLGKGVLFLETASRGYRGWANVEVIPVEMDVEMDAPLYFKQALDQADEEWSVHKKVIDTSQKGLRRSIPDNMPYFFIEWSR